MTAHTRISRDPAGTDIPMAALRSASLLPADRGVLP